MLIIKINVFIFLIDLLSSIKFRENKFNNNYIKINSDYNKVNTNINYGKFK